MKCRILEDGTVISCDGTTHHIHSLEHRPDTEYRCVPRTHLLSDWYDSLEEAMEKQKRKPNPCECGFVK